MFPNIDSIEYNVNDFSGLMDVSYIRCIKIDIGLWNKTKSYPR